MHVLSYAAALEDTVFSLLKRAWARSATESRDDWAVHGVEYSDMRQYTVPRDPLGLKLMHWAESLK
jgi:hypothetical protein